MNAHRLLLAACAAALVAGAGAATAAVAPPAAKTLPSVSGTTRDGSVLTTSNGSWTNSPTGFTYEWLRCDSGGGSCLQIANANSKRYTLTSADVSHRIRSEVIAANAGGSTSATSRATSVISGQGTAPKNTAGPTIGGTAQEGQTLSAIPGSWSGAAPIAFAYQWSRCDGAGNGCAAIPGATGQTYNATSADVTHTLRITVQASNSRGSSSATTPPSAVIAPSKSGGAAVSIQTISLPDRLVVDNVKFSPQPLGGRRPLTARFHVSDLRGFSVQGALVYALGLPYGWTRSTGEVATDGSGWATVTFNPTARMPKSGALVVFVRARKPGEDLLAGVSTRRLVQATIR